MIAREQVADLHPGDVVEISIPSAKIIGELRSHLGTGLSIAPALVVRRADGELSGQWEGWALTVVSRAPRPLYVNHDRTEVVAGDIAKDADGKVWHAIGNSAYGELRWWGWNTDNGKWMHVGLKWHKHPVRLLVDGETGQVVP